MSALTTLDRATHLDRDVVTTDYPSSSRRIARRRASRNSSARTRDTGRGCIRCARRVRSSLVRVRFVGLTEAEGGREETSLLSDVLLRVVANNRPRFGAKEERAGISADNRENISAFRLRPARRTVNGPTAAPSRTCNRGRIDRASNFTIFASRGATRGSSKSGARAGVTRLSREPYQSEQISARTNRPESSAAFGRSIRLYERCSSTLTTTILPMLANSRARLRGRSSGTAASGCPSRSAVERHAVATLSVSNFHI